MKIDHTPAVTPPNRVVYWLTEKETTTALRRYLIQEGKPVPEGNATIYGGSKCPHKPRLVVGLVIDYPGPPMEKLWPYRT